MCRFGNESRWEIGMNRIRKGFGCFLKLNADADTAAQLSPSRNRITHGDDNTDAGRGHQNGGIPPRGHALLVALPMWWQQPARR